MESSRILRGLLLVVLLSVLCHGQASSEVSAEDLDVGNPDPGADKELVSVRAETRQSVETDSVLFSM